MPKILVYSFFVLQELVTKTVEWSGREMIDCINIISQCSFPRGIALTFLKRNNRNRINY